MVCSIAAETVTAESLKQVSIAIAASVVVSILAEGVEVRGNVDRYEPSKRKMMETTMTCINLNFLPKAA